MRDPDRIGGDSSDSKQQLPRMENRELAQERKRRKGMRLNLRLEGGKITSDAEEYFIEDINGEESALPQT